MIHLEVGEATDTGKVRDHNEDGYLIDRELELIAVADGMGGHRGGEVASATALEALHAAFSENGGLRDAVLAANEAVLDRADESPELRGMGTTLTAGVLGDDDTLLVGHVGDSRAYLLQEGALSRITTDHSLVEELIAAGELTEQEAERDPRRSMITRALGLEAGDEVVLYPVPLAPGDRVMICSDGLTTMIGEDAILDVLASEPDPTSAAQRLVDAANAAGGVDNITVVVVDALVEPVDVEEAEPEVEVRKRRFGIFR
ncbi:MAG: Stp1/IreP family PP2C-type Ser/Thr phosphatase, partial [Dehalococcoidia bacterium]